MPAIGCDANGSRIPADGNETERTTLAGRAHVKNGDVVVVGIGHEQCLSVRRKRQAVRSRAGRQTRIQRSDQCLQRFPGFRINYGHAVSRGVGHIQNFSGRREEHFAGMFLGRPAGDELVGVQVDDCHGGLRPEADVEALSFLVEPAGVRKRRFVRYILERRLRPLDCGGGSFIDRARWWCRSHQPVGWAQRYIGHLRRIVQVQSRDALAPHVRDEETFGVAAQRQSRGYAAFLHVAHLENLRIRKVAVLERKGADHLIPGAAAKQPLAIGREFDPIKRLIHWKFAQDFLRRDIDH